MILTIDVGNSNIVSVVYDQSGHELFEKREETLKNATSKEYIELFKQLRAEIKTFEIDKITLSCVVPSMCPHIVNALKSEFNQPVYSIEATKITELNVKLENPNELGADFVATTLGAFNKYDKPVIIIDMGSATKLSVVDRKMNFLGGIIQPGIGLMAKSLHQHIPHLPPIEIDKPPVILGRSTIESIQSGIVNGAKASVVQLARQIEDEIGESCVKVITGGYSNLFYDTTEFIVDKHLLNDGLYYFSQRGDLNE